MSSHIVKKTAVLVSAPVSASVSADKFRVSEVLAKSGTGSPLNFILTT